MRTLIVTAARLPVNRNEYLPRPGLSMCTSGCSRNPSRAHRPVPKGTTAADVVHRQARVRRFIPAQRLVNQRAFSGAAVGLILPGGVDGAGTGSGACWRRRSAAAFSCFAVSLDSVAAALN